jgi:hypothetical protein
MPEQTFKKFIPFAKVDVAKREVWGIVTAEVKDKGGEICDYESTVPYYKAWSAEFVKATDGKSVGNLRYMHQMRVVGKGVGLEFRDTDKEIWMGYKVTEDAAWKDVEDSVLTGFSQGGRYVKGPDAEGRYTADPSEVSLVDNPALGVCHFAFIRANGEVEMRKVRSEPVPEFVATLQKAPVFTDLRAAINAHFDKAAATATPATREEITEIVRKAVSDFVKGEAKTKSVDGVELPPKCFAFVGDKDDPSTWKLPIEFPGDDEKTKTHIQNALARFGQTEGIPEDEKAGVLKRIKAAAKKHGIDTESEDANKALDGIRLVKGALDLVQKGMYDVAQFAGLIDALSWLQRMADMERESEGDESTVPAELLDLIGQLCQNFLAMAEEETKELLTRPAGAFFATTSTLRKASSLLTKAAAKIQQTAGEPAKKENTTMSELTLTKKASLSDHLAKAKEMASDHHEKMQAQIDKCAKCVGGDDDKDKEEKAAKAAAGTAGTTAAVAVGADAIADFNKSANAAVNTVIEAMTDKFMKFMEKLENTLEPPKAAQADPAAGRVVNKTEDTGIVPAADGTAAAGAAAGAAAAAPRFVPVNSGAPADPKVREAFKALRGAPLSE